jgi:hypothetical protein
MGGTEPYISTYEYDVAGNLIHRVAPSLDLTFDYSCW